jgi:hypothetical protein
VTTLFLNSRRSDVGRSPLWPPTAAAPYLLRERKMQPLTVRLHIAALRFFFVKTLI